MKLKSLFTLKTRHFELPCVSSWGFFFPSFACHAKATAAVAFACLVLFEIIYSHSLIMKEILRAKMSQMVPPNVMMITAAAANATVEIMTQKR